MFSVSRPYSPNGSSSRRNCWSANGAVHELVNADVLKGFLHRLKSGVRQETEDVKIQ